MDDPLAVAVLESVGHHADTLARLILGVPMVVAVVGGESRVMSHERQAVGGRCAGGGDGGNGSSTVGRMREQQSCS